MRNSSTMPPAASTAMTLRMSRVRRAGNMFTSSSVIALPITAGMMRNGTNTAEHDERKERPAVIHRRRTRRTSARPCSTTIQLECTSVSSSFATYSLSQSTGADDEQVEIAREKEARQRGDDVRQQQDREEPDEDQPEQLAGEQRPDLRHAAEVRAAAGTARRR